MNCNYLVEYNMRNIFLEKSLTKWGRRVNARSSYKIQNGASIWINSLKCYEFYFYCMSKPKSIKISTIKLFQKRKKKSGTSLPASLCT